MYSRKLLIMGKEVDRNT